MLMKNSAPQTGCAVFLRLSQFWKNKKEDDQVILFIICSAFFFIILLVLQRESRQEPPRWRALSLWRQELQPKEGCE